MMRILLPALLSITILSACSEKKQIELSSGKWRATLSIQGNEVPFNMEIVKDSSNNYDAYILNARERLLLDEVNISGDSVIIPLHIFDATLRAKVDDGKMRGVFVKHYDKDYRLPFYAEHGITYRFKSSPMAKSETDFSGKYKVSFLEERDTVEAIGIFSQEGSTVTGSFLTPTGDYRFLEGISVGDSLHLSTFDGNYVYLFKARGNGESIEGRFISGKTKNIAWTAIKDDNASLDGADSQTFLKEGYERIEFAFPDVNGDTVRLDDEKYKNKVVVLQLFGTWCPNCMDEIKFLAPWYDQNKDRGVEIIGLAYERKADFTYASGRVKRMIEKLKVNYDCAIAGSNDKAQASETLPMINKVAVYPTTIFIGRDGKVKKIHTGYSGPGTGIYYEQGVEQFNETINALLNEGKGASTAKI